MILIYPPVSKSCEPPAGVALLAGALKQHHIACKVIDANVEAMLWLSHHGHKHHSHDLLHHHSHDRPHHFHDRPHISHKHPHVFHKHLPHLNSKADKLFDTNPLDSWTKRAVSHLSRNLNDIRDIQLYHNISRYRQRIMDINRVINTAVNGRYKISLSDYSDAELSPLRSRDLLTAARNYAENPFYPYFESRLAREIESGHLALKTKLDHSARKTELDHSARKTELDHSARKIEFDHSARKIESDFIGISLCYLSQALTAFALAGWIKARFPCKKIIMGGGLVTSWMSNPDWSDPFQELIDIMVKGRGEEILIHIAGGNMAVRGIGGGAAVRDEPVRGEALRGDSSGEHHLNHEKFTPNFDFCNWDSYIAPGRILPFRTAGGCYWRRCRFCPERAEGRPWLPGKNSDLLSDLNFLSKKYDLDYIHFIDDAISPSFLKAIATAGGIHSLTWYGFVRFSKELADPEFCRALYQSGCRMLKLGLESGDQTVLDRMEKGTRLELASQVLTALDAAGIHTYVYLLFGTAFEDETAARKTLEYVVEHSNRISFLNLAIFNLPRFSEDARHLETSMFYGGDLSLYLDFKHPSGWGRKQIRQFLDKTFKKDKGISAILKNDPPFFTSNHAMFTIV